jgi:hypothetical protein
MNRESSAFYHDPPMWVGTSPVDHTVSPPVLDFDSLREPVFETELSGAIKLRVTREGLFKFGFAEWEPGVYPPEEGGRLAPFDAQVTVILARTTVMNAFLAFIYTNELKLHRFSRDQMVVTPETIIPTGGFDDDLSMGFGNQRVSHLALSSFPSTYLPSLPATMDSRIQMRGVPLPIDVLTRSTSDTSTLIDNWGTDGLLLADLFLRASRAYQDHNYSAALINHWAITEKLLQELWSKYQDDNKERGGKEFITGERRKRLRDGRTFTAAVISEALSFADYISHDLYLKMGKTRKARNDWIHPPGKPITRKHAVESTEVCQEMLKLVRDIELIGQTGSKIHG